MRLEVVNHQISLVGKVKEKARIEDALNAFHDYLYGGVVCGGFDNSVEECDLIDLGFDYDQDEYTVKDIFNFWREFKKLNKG